MSSGRFVPAHNQVDFSRARWAPVMNCVVRHRRLILLIKRSRKLSFYPGRWNGVSGFLDDHQSLPSKVRSELKEELGLKSADIKAIKPGRIFLQDEPKYKKTSIVQPVLVEVNQANVILDWESDDWRWVSLPAVKKMKLVPGFLRVLRAVGL